MDGSKGRVSLAHFEEAGSDRRIRRSIIDPEKPQTSLSATALRSFYRVLLFIEEPLDGGKGFPSILLDDLDCSYRGKASFFASL